MTPEIKLKRTYEPASPEDGFRIFVDRLWPRGLSHANFPYDLWDKQIAPSTELRQWFHAAPAQERWAEFEKRYEEELSQNPEFSQLLEIVKQHPVVTLLYSEHNVEYNNAVVVRDMLLRSMGSAS